MLLKLGRDDAHYKVYQMVHILMLLWQHARFQAPVSLQTEILPCATQQAKGKIPGLI